MLSHVLQTATELEAEDVCVVYGHGGEAVPAAIGGDNVRWVLQSEQLGTGHAVQQAMPETPDENQVLILYGDVPLLKVTTLSRLLESTLADEISVLSVELDEPSGYGRILRDGDNIIGIVEQKDASDAEQAIGEINTGVMVCPAARLRAWLENLGNDNSQGEYYLTDVIGMAVADRVTVKGIKADAWTEVMGINDKKQLAEAERALQLKRVAALMEAGVGFADPARVDIRGTLQCGQDVFIDVNAIFEGDVVLGDNVTIESNNLIRDSRLGSGTLVHSNCHIEGATTGSNCEIGPFARLRPGAELANKVKIGNFVELKKSTVADGSKVNHLTYVGDTDIGKGVNVGAGTITCNYDGVNKHRTQIGDGAFIGSGVELVAPVKVGKGATIGAGATLTRDAPENELTIERSRQKTIRGWKKPENK